MKIGAYTFGSMTVDGKVYTRDLYIVPGKIYADWWRKDGHLLCMDDLVEVIAAQPQILIVGTGDSGAMRVLPEVRSAIKDKRIELIVEDTHKAVQLFNEHDGAGKKVAGAFHLTC